MTIQLKGLIRFSYPAEGGFSRLKEPAESQIARLYDPARLEHRFHLFESITLPSVQNQECQDFTLGVLVGEDLPEPWLSRLHDLVQGIDTMQIIMLPRVQHFHSTVLSFSAIPNDEATTHIATFRLDDDDAMHRTTIGRLKELNTILAGRGDTRNPMMIGFNRGYFLDFTRRELGISEVTERTPLGIGLSLTVPKGNKLNVFRRNHRAVAAHFDCYTDVSQPMWVRTVHDNNDSEPVNTGRSDQIELADKVEEFKRDYGFDLMALQNHHRNS